MPYHCQLHRRNSELYVSSMWLTIDCAGIGVSLAAIKFEGNTYRFAISRKDLLLLNLKNNSRLQTRQINPFILARYKRMLDALLDCLKNSAPGWSVPQCTLFFCPKNALASSLKAQTTAPLFQKKRYLSKTKKQFWKTRNQTKNDGEP